MLDAPVSGGDVGASDGTLSIMVGGEEDDFERASPLLEEMGETVVHVGETGAGQVVKACNPIVVALVIEAVAEALVLGSKAGVLPVGSWMRSQGVLRPTGAWRSRARSYCPATSPPGARSKPSQGSGDSTGREKGVRGDAPCHGARGPDVRGAGGQGRW
jgi:2-hydroxy-3-oxopropionate reductase